MAETDNSLFPSLTWSRFNSTFRLPDNDDAARVANEVKAHVDTWVQTSLAQLEVDMEARAQRTVNQMTDQVASTKKELDAIIGQVNSLAQEIAKLAQGDAGLEPKLANLVVAGEEAREAVRIAANQWEEHGRNAVATVKAIVSTVAKAAV